MGAPLCGEATGIALNLSTKCFVKWMAVEAVLLSCRLVPEFCAFRSSIIVRKRIPKTLDLQQVADGCILVQSFVRPYQVAFTVPLRDLGLSSPFQKGVIVGRSECLLSAPRFQEVTRCARNGFLERPGSPISSGPVAATSARSRFSLPSRVRASKLPPQRELKFSGVLGAGNYSEIGGAEDSAGEIEIRVIKSIEGIRAELYGLVLAKTPGFLQR